MSGQETEPIVTGLEEDEEVERKIDGTVLTMNSFCRCVSLTQLTYWHHAVKIPHRQL